MSATPSSPGARSWSTRGAGSSASSAGTVSAPRRSSTATFQERSVAAVAQRAWAAKLRALVREHWGPLDAPTSSFPGGAALRAGATAWVLAQEEAARSLGKALVWASQHGAEEVHLLAEADGGLLARRARAFRHSPAVWTIRGRALDRAQPDPPAEQPALDAAVATLADVISEAGADVVVEHGVLRGEVLGLEVARAVVDEHGPFLEVGVGKHDRLAQRLLRGDRPRRDALEEVVSIVRAHRRSDAQSHPLRQLAPERWLRACLVADPSLVGADQLWPVPPPVPSGGLRVSGPAPAAGIDGRGRPVLVVCSTGIDLDLVPTAADAWLADARRPRLLIVVPARDDHPLLHTLVGALAEPAEVVTVPDDWRQP